MTVDLNVRLNRVLRSRRKGPEIFVRQNDDETATFQRYFSIKGWPGPHAKIPDCSPAKYTRQHYTGCPAKNVPTLVSG